LPTQKLGELYPNFEQPKLKALPPLILFKEKELIHKK